MKLDLAHIYKPQSLKSTLVRARELPFGESTTHLSVGGGYSVDSDGRQSVGLSSHAVEQLHAIGLFHRALPPYNRL